MSSADTTKVAHLVSLTVFSAGRDLGKRVVCRRDGTLDKRALGEMSSGTADTHHIQTLGQFQKLRRKFKPKQARAYGVCQHEVATIAGKDEVAAIAPENRTRGD